VPVIRPGLPRSRQVGRSGPVKSPILTRTECQIFENKIVILVSLSSVTRFYLPHLSTVRDGPVHGPARSTIRSGPVHGSARDWPARSIFGFKENRPTVGPDQGKARSGDGPVRSGPVHGHGPVRNELDRTNFFNPLILPGPDSSVPFSILYSK
jgi:hypothetical protein